MGDDFFAGKFPFVDLNSGGDVRGMAKNVEQVIARLPPDVKIIPGHGPLSNINDLKLYQRMLVETTDLVERKMKSGKTLEQITAEGLPETWKEWGTGFMKTGQWIETIYRSLSKSAAGG
jgi:glyoxylase-like metal-dependent hydrolase (beta-lactamase superfamily II)